MYLKLSQILIVALNKKQLSNLSQKLFFKYFHISSIVYSNLTHSYSEKYEIFTNSSLSLSNNLFNISTILSIIHNSLEKSYLTSNNISLISLNTTFIFAHNV